LTVAGDLFTHFRITTSCCSQVGHPTKSARLLLRPTALAAACSSKHKHNCSSRFRHSSKSADLLLPSRPAIEGRCSKGRCQTLQNRHRRSLPRSTRIDGNLVGLLTRASLNQGCLPKAFKPQWHSARFSALTVAGAVLEFHQLPKTPSLLVIGSSRNKSQDFARHQAAQPSPRENRAAFLGVCGREILAVRLSVFLRGQSGGEWAVESRHSL